MKGLGMNINHSWCTHGQMLQTERLYLPKICLLNPNAQDDGSRKWRLFGKVGLYLYEWD